MGTRGISWLLTVAVLAIGCNDDGSSASSDASPVDASADAGPPDAGPPDAVPAPDAATSAPDAAPPAPDAAPPAPDADPTPDAAPQDATPPTVDSALPDSALPAADAGPTDAAVPPQDAAPQPDAGACTPEGESYPVVPGALPCCPGLTAIGCDAPDGDGVCPGGCAGAAFCTRCGDDACGPGENHCNCPEDCAVGCARTRDCLDHPAPIRCPGVWRCDPDREVVASHYGDDGCNYTCTFELPACEPAGEPCADGDLCRPCPGAACDMNPFVCLAFDQAVACPDDPRICEGLAHDDCVGAWACVDQVCTWRCD